MSSHAALGVVRAGVAELKGTGVRINCISPGQIDVGVKSQDLEANGSSAGGHLENPSITSPPASKTEHQINGGERAGLPMEVARVAGFLASGFSSYVTGANLVVDVGASATNPLLSPMSL